MAKTEKGASKLKDAEIAEYKRNQAANEGLDDKMKMVGRDLPEGHPEVIRRHNNMLRDSRTFLGRANVKSPVVKHQ